MKIKKDDNVIVIAGKDKGKTGKIRQSIPKDEKVIVEGANMVKRHQKPRGPGQPGGIIEKEAPLAISNVMILDNENKPSRIGYEVDAEGRKWRIYRSTGQRIDPEPINDPTK